MASKLRSPLRVSIVGGTGYTGAELLRLVVTHPGITLAKVVGSSTAGQRLCDVLPAFVGVIDQEVEAFDAAAIAAVSDAVFCALPHAASAKAVAALRAHDVVVFDLSADFRLRDLPTYERWYGEHPEHELFGTAAYGLPELHREAIRQADLVAVPGCFPTSVILALAPLLHAGLVEPSDIIADSKSGASGAGRKARRDLILAESGESIRAYKTGGRHRHTPEIQQELSAVAGEQVSVLFTPHIVPMSRGILSTIYARGKEGASSEDCFEAARSFYADSPWVSVLPVGAHPSTLAVRGSARAQVAYIRDEAGSRIVGQCVIDNLGKGAAGQALACFNLRFGLDEDTGLKHVGMWP